jgi:large subunit ribosomal protein L15
MVVRKADRKSRKFRGHRAQGYGNHKRHRGSGSIGGSGMSGLHKHKWSTTLKEHPDHFGKHGFVRPRTNTRKIKVINVSELSALAGEKKQLRLEELGYAKVIGSGSIEKPIEVFARAFSAHAKEKIEAAGGKAIEMAEQDSDAVADSDGHEKVLPSMQGKKPVQEKKSK